MKQEDKSRRDAYLYALEYIAKNAYLTIPAYDRQEAIRRIVERFPEVGQSGAVDAVDAASEDVADLFIDAKEEVGAKAAFYAARFQKTFGGEEESER